MDRQNHKKNNDIIPTRLTAEHLEEKHKRALKQKQKEAFTEKLRLSLSHNRISLFVQPIKTLPQRKTAFFEIFGRLCLHPGEYLPACDYMNFAKEEHLINRLDTKVLLQTLQLIKDQRRRSIAAKGYFINIKPFTLRNGVFMNNLVGEMAEKPELAKLLIFEMRQKDFLMLSPSEIKIIQALGQTGCRFSLDHVTEVPETAQNMHMHYISYLKIKALHIQQESHTDKSFENFLRKKRLMDINDITMIIERTESEKEVLSALDYDIQYAQGYLFGRPDFQSVYSREKKQA